MSRQVHESGSADDQRSPWEPPTLTVLGTLKDIVRAASKPSGAGDEDFPGRKPPGL